MDKNSQRYSEKRFGAYLCQDLGGGEGVKKKILSDSAIKILFLMFTAKTFLQY